MRVCLRVSFIGVLFLTSLWPYLSLASNSPPLAPSLLRRGLGAVGGGTGLHFKPIAFSFRSDPGLRSEEEAEIATNVQLLTLTPDFALIDLAVIGIQERPVLVPVPFQDEVLDND